MVRAVVDTARQEDVPGIVNLLLRCCVNVLLSAIDFLNKFTINFAAITGEAYCSSARMTYELLKRNLLSAVFVETISTRLLGGIVFVVSAIYAIAVCRHFKYLFFSLLITALDCLFVIWYVRNYSYFAHLIPQTDVVALDDDTFSNCHLPHSGVPSDRKRGRKGDYIYSNIIL